MSESETNEQALVVAEKGTPLPVFSGAEMATALTAYRELQAALDRSMPDQIMELEGRPFRKKGYWRAIAVAFNLTAEPLSEDRRVEGHFEDGRENFGWVVTYRAVAPNGRTATGDGSCFAVEKARRFRCAHPEKEGSRRTLHYPADQCPDFDPDYQWRTLPGQATEHNIRSHAHTRSYNRAVSNLVGFGEVSAEEIEREERDGHQGTDHHRTPERKSGATGKPITEGQVRLLFGRAKTAFGKDGYEQKVRDYIGATFGLEKETDLTTDQLDAVLAWMQGGGKAA